MKKLITLMLVLSAFFAAQTALATDVCSNEPWQPTDFYVENHRVNWLLSMSCVDSEVLTTMPVGSVMHVIGKTEGWHKLETESGLVGWMWEDYVQPTSKPFNPGGAEPEPEPYVEPTPEPVEYVAMRDISGHKYEDAIWFVYNNDIVQGYEDGSYKPDQQINRAELLKIIVESKYEDEFETFDNMGCFTDVDSNQWYSKYVCFGLAEEIVEGYTDGSFKPSIEINFVEALKIAFIGIFDSYSEGSPWYKNIVDDAGMMNVIPLDVDSFSTKLTRGQMAEMITRMVKYQQDGDENLVKMPDSHLSEYLGDTIMYNVTYESLENGVNVEDVALTNGCVWGAQVFENGEINDSSCECRSGDWYCAD